MLCEIRIDNFAIIDHLEVQFSPGFNVITGETGAGKSIIIDAVDLLLGGRGDADFVRAGTDKATIEGVFKIPKPLLSDIKTLLESEGVDPADTPDEIILTRELRSNGRNVCRVNGSNVSLQFFRTLGEKMVDIHGQSEHLSLLKAREHINLLDGYANLRDQRSATSVLNHKLKQVRAEIDNLLQDEAALARRVDMLGYQIEEIKAVAPELGEEETLREERTRLANAEQLASLTAEVQQILYEGSDDSSPSAVDLLNQAVASLTKLAKIEPAFEEQHTLAESLAVQADELARAVRTYYDRVEYNPSRLVEVEERMDALTRLKRKYGGTLEAVLSYREKAQKDLSDITHSEERLVELRQQEETLLHQIGDIAVRLSSARAKASKVLSQGIEAEMQDLRMEGARFEVSITQEEDPEGCYVGEQRLKFDSTGIDHVEFLIAANRGEPLRPLVKVASGGETARIMLAMKGVLSRADSTPTLIFDEIDQGIGGRVGATVGQKLWNLSDGHQVLCVTHLAQLAGFGDAHFKVMKGSRGDRIVTTVVPLDDKARVEEMAEMLGAETVSAKQSAHDILMLARRSKENKGVQSALL
ncbi:MAG: DNA repair protein RecN [Chloroflexota bacterium]